MRKLRNDPNCANELQQWRDLAAQLTGMHGMKPETAMQMLRDNVTEWRARVEEVEGGAE